MITKNGKPLSPGTAAATVSARRQNDQTANRTATVDIPTECERLQSALNEVAKNLTAEYQAAVTAGEQDTADILEIHKMMIEDEDVRSSLFSAVQNDGVSAETAVRRTEALFTEQFSAMDDEYIKERAADVRDICGRLTARLSGQTALLPTEDYILAVREVLPSDITSPDAHLRAVITQNTSPLSHAAILLRAAKIPTVTGIDIAAIPDGTFAAVDGTNGTVCIEPDEKTLAALLHRVKEPHTLFKRFTTDTPPCKLCINIGAEQNFTALPPHCNGVGLLRTEFLYIGQPELPDEQQQFEYYRSILLAAKGKEVTIRTFDIGADKTTPLLPLPAEQNPALGCRGCRVYTVYPEVLTTQLRAILRAAVYGNARILFPMITDAEEMEQLCRTVQDTAKALQKEGIAFVLPPLGAMIETPAAALLSEDIAKVSDFFSIGTNDLSQYTLALDRQNELPGALPDPNRKALLHLISITVQNARAAGITVSICGELAADPTLTNTFVSLGITELSVSPSVFPD